MILTVTCCWVENVTRIMHHTPMFMRLQCPRVLAGRYSFTQVYNLLHMKYIILMRTELTNSILT
jgi:hypothetical protein